MDARAGTMGLFLIGKEETGWGWESRMMGSNCMEATHGDFLAGQRTMEGPE